MFRLALLQSRHIYRLAVALLFVSMAMSTSMSAAAQSVAPALDLAAMVLTPTDTADAGFKGFGAFPGSVGTVQDCVTPYLSDGTDFDNDVRTYHGFGLKRCYDGFVMNENAGGYPDLTIGSHVYEFADSDGAADAWARFTKKQIPTDQQPDGKVGDQSLTFPTTRNRQQGDRYSNLGIVIQRANLILFVIEDGNVNKPDLSLADIASLGDRLVDRADLVRTGKSPALGLRIARYGGPGVGVLQEGYRQLDGSFIPLSGESDTDQQARADSYGGATSVYELAARMDPKHDNYVADSPDNVSLTTVLLSFGDEQAASTWLHGVRKQLESQPTVRDVTPVDDAPTYGDESLTFETTRQSRSGSTSEDRIVYVRTKSDVTWLRLLAVRRVSEDALAAMISNQLDCMVSARCDGFQRRPDELTTSSTGNTSTPVASSGSGNNRPVPVATALPDKVPRSDNVGT